VFTYDVTQLATSELFQIRFEISDTNSATPLFQDEEINWAISVESNHWGAAARCAEILARKYMQLADVQLGRNLKIEYSKRSSGYAELAKSLRAKSLGMIVPFAGGRSIPDKLDAAQDVDAVQPLFTKAGGANPRIGGTTTDPLASTTGF
jgi:hypothetical protein